MPPTSKKAATGLTYPTREELMALPVGRLADALRECNEHMALLAEVVNARAGETE